MNRIPFRSVWLMLKQMRLRKESPHGGLADFHPARVSHRNKYGKDPRQANDQGVTGRRYLSSRRRTRARSKNAGSLSGEQENLRNTAGAQIGFRQRPDLQWLHRLRRGGHRRRGRLLGDLHRLQGRPRRPSEGRSGVAVPRAGAVAGRGLSQDNVVIHGRTRRHGRKPAQARRAGAGLGDRRAHEANGRRRRHVASARTPTTAYW